MKNKCLFGICFFTITLFYGCSNFLSGGNLKNEIEDMIAFQQSEDIKIYLQANPETGSFLSENSINIKVGYSVDIQFTLRTEKYAFNSFVAVDSSNENISKADKVSITMLSSEEELLRGIYKAQITLLSADRNILIKAVCPIIPDYTYSPAYTLIGVPQDSKIEITFNVPVNPEYFKDLKNITISCDSEDITTSYDSPSFTEDKKTMFLILKKNTYLMKPEDDRKDIFVSLNLCSDSLFLDSTTVIPFKENLEWSFRINNLKDDISPVLYNLSVFKTNEDLVKNENPLLDTDYYTYADNTKIVSGELVKNNIKRNHVKNIWLGFEAEDDRNGSGLKEIIVTESLIRDVYGNDFIIPETVISRISIDDERVNIINVSDSRYKISFNHNFILQSDGVVRVTINVCDYANNASTGISYDVIKDTRTAKPEGIYFDSSTFNCNIPDANGIYTLTVAPGRCQEEAYTTDMQNTKYYESTSTYTEDELPGIIYKSVLYSYDNKNYIEVPLKNVQKDYVNYYAGNYYVTYHYFDISRDTSKDLYIKVITEDSLGNQEEYVQIIQKNVRVLNATNSDSSYILDLSEKPYQSCALYYRYEDLNGILSEFMPYNIENSVYINSKTAYISFTTQKITIESAFFTGKNNGKYYFYVQPMYNDTRVHYGNKTFTKLQGCAGEGFPVYYNVEKPDNTITLEQIPKFDVNIADPELNTGKRTISVTLDASFLPESNINYYYCAKTTRNTYFFNSSVFEVDSGYTYKISVIVSDKNGNFKESEYKEVDAKYDNIPPTVYAINYYRYRGDYLRVSVPKDNSKIYEIAPGVGQIEIFCGNSGDYTESQIEDLKKITLNYSTSEKEIYIPCDRLDKDYIYIKARDANGNYKYSCGRKNTIDFINTKPDVYINAANEIVVNCDDTMYYVTIEYLNSNREWKKIAETEQIKKDGTSNTYTKSYVLTEENKDCLFRVHLSHNYYPSYYKNEIYDVLYLKNGISFTDSNKCYLKNMLEGINGISVLCDNFAFVHTMYSVTNYGKDISMWEKCALEESSDYNNVSFNYNFNCKNIPDDSYYTTICYFADGSILQTLPQKKL